MEDCFLFTKLKDYIFLTLDVMMFVDYQDSLKFIFSLNKQARQFIEKNFIVLRNGFTNDGLIDINFSSDSLIQFYNYDQLEKVFF